MDCNLWVNWDVTFGSDRWIGSVDTVKSVRRIGDAGDGSDGVTVGFNPGSNESFGSDASDGCCLMGGAGRKAHHGLSSGMRKRHATSHLVAWNTANGGFNAAELVTSQAPLTTRGTQSLNLTKQIIMDPIQDTTTALTTTTAQLPAEQEVARGKGTVRVQGFSVQGSASQIKAQLKMADPKLSAKALSRKVNEVLRGERAVREQLGMAWLQACYQDGLVPSHGERTKSGAKLVMKSAPEPIEAPTVSEELIVEKVSKLEALLKSLGATDEDIAKATA